MGKVEICGINTSQLPNLKYKEQLEVLAKIKKGDLQARQYFIVANFRLVLSVIQRFLKKSCNDDVFQIGCVGLIKAIDNFDPKFNVRFSTYAVPMIIGEIKRYLRDNNSIRVSRSMRDTAYKALQSKERLSRILPNEPTIEEIALDIGSTYKAVMFALSATSNTTSLNETVYDEGSKSICLLDKIEADSKTNDDMLEDIMLKRAIEKLSEREREILHLRYFVGKTQIEVSEEVGISQAQVSRLEKNALNYIKKNL